MCQYVLQRQQRFLDYFLSYTDSTQIKYTNKLFSWSKKKSSRLLMAVGTVDIYAKLKLLCFILILNQNKTTRLALFRKML